LAQLAPFGGGQLEQELAQQAQEVDGPSGRSWAFGRVARPLDWGWWRNRNTGRPIGQDSGKRAARQRREGAGRKREASEKEPKGSKFSGRLNKQGTLCTWNSLA